MTRRSGLMAAIALGIVGLVAAIAITQSRPPAPVTTIEQASLRLAWVYDMAEVGVFVAQDKGYFQRHQLDLKVEPGGFGLDPIKLVAAGTNDFGVAGAGNLLLARAQGVPVIAIAVEFQLTPVGFIVRKDSGIRSFKDFVGKRVGIQTGSDTDVLYRALLVRNGMNSNQVREVPIQYDPSPFAAGQIDVLPGYVTNQPVTLKSKGIDVAVISAASQGLTYYGNVYFTSEKMVTEHPDRVRRFVAAVREGWIAALGDKQAATGAVKARAKDFEMSDLDVIYDAVVPFIRPESATPLLGMTDERWRMTAQVLEDAGLLKGRVDVSKAYTNVFAR